MPKAIKVAYLLGSLNRGGAETMLLDLMNQHDLVPYEMIGISRHEGELGDSFYCSGVPFIRLSVGKNLNIIGYLTKLRQLLKTHHINIVHSHQSVIQFMAF
jgi:hypothetical protein